MKTRRGFFICTNSFVGEKLLVNADFGVFLWSGAFSLQMNFVLIAVVPSFCAPMTVSHSGEMPSRWCEHPVFIRL